MAFKEDESKTKDRAEGNKENKHHSVFGHDYISLYFEGIPKIIAMMINNEKDYNTSEKSGRYTVMFGNEKENDSSSDRRGRAADRRRGVLRPEVLSL